MALNLILALGVISGICVIGGVAAFALQRKGKAYVLSIEKDYRNPTSPKITYYCLVDRPAKALRLYKSLLSFKPAKNIPMFDINAYADAQKKVRCVRGVTGNPQDDMIVPLALTIPSQAGALDYANKMSDAIIMTMNPILTQMKLTPEQIEELTKSIKTDFSKEWVMGKMGVVAVQNSNIVTLSQKMFIASLANRANEFVTERGGWLERHGTLFMLGIILLFVAVASVIMIYGVNNFLSNLNTLTHSAVSLAQVAGVNTNTLTGTAPLIPKIPAT